MTKEKQQFVTAGFNKSTRYEFTKVAVTKVIVIKHLQLTISAIPAMFGPAFCFFNRREVCFW